MDDTISRQAAIDVLHGYFDGMLETDTVCPADIYGLFECIPSAQPDVSDTNVGDMVSRQAVKDWLLKWEGYIDMDTIARMQCRVIDIRPHRKKDVKQLPSVQPELIRCKDCKHNPKHEWFGCPMSHLSEKQRPDTAWCWRAERRTDEQIH